MRNIKASIYHRVLRPLIFENRRKRFHGLLPDEWYWADALAVEWGYFADFDTKDFGRPTPERAREMLRIMEGGT